MNVVSAKSQSSNATERGLEREIYTEQIESIENPFLKTYFSYRKPLTAYEELASFSLMPAENSLSFVKDKLEEALSSNSVKSLAYAKLGAFFGLLGVADQRKVMKFLSKQNDSGLKNYFIDHFMQHGKTFAQVKSLAKAFGLNEIKRLDRGRLFSRGFQYYIYAHVMHELKKLKLPNYKNITTFVTPAEKEEKDDFGAGLGLEDKNCIEEGSSESKADLANGVAETRLPYQLLLDELLELRKKIELIKDQVIVADLSLRDLSKTRGAEVVSSLLEVIDSTCNIIKTCEKEKDEVAESLKRSLLRLKIEARYGVSTIDQHESYQDRGCWSLEQLTELDETLKLLPVRVRLLVMNLKQIERQEFFVNGDKDEEYIVKKGKLVIPDATAKYDEIKEDNGIMAEHSFQDFIAQGLAEFMLRNSDPWPEELDLEDELLSDFNPGLMAVEFLKYYDWKVIDKKRYRLRHKKLSVAIDGEVHSIGREVTHKGERLIFYYDDSEKALYSSKTRMACIEAPANRVPITPHWVSLFAHYLTRTDFMIMRCPQMFRCFEADFRAHGNKPAVFDELNDIIEYQGYTRGE